MIADNVNSVISARGVSKEFDGASGRRVALASTDLDVRAGEFVALLGPSGCGKSTLLSLLGGFASPSSGEVLLDGRLLTAPDRRVVTIFQDYGLFPWRSVVGNIEYGLEVAGWNKSKRREEAMRWLAAVGLADAAGAQVAELSGGMKQRVNLARALAVSPEVLLMDEPLGALDAITKAQVQEQLRGIAQGSSATFVLVTHDIDEAVYLADRIMVMTSCPGTIAEEIAVPMAHPRDRSSMEFAHFRVRLLESLHLAHHAESEYDI